MTRLGNLLLTSRLSLCPSERANSRRTPGGNGEIETPLRLIENCWLAPCLVEDARVVHGAVRPTSRTTARSSGRCRAAATRFSRTGVFKLQPKEELPKSPDEADGLAMTFAPTGGRANLRWIE